VSGRGAVPGPWRALLRLALRAHPPALRRRFGREIEGAFEDGWLEHGGFARRAAFLLRTTVDLVAVGFQERARALRGGRVDAVPGHEGRGRDMGSVTDAVRQDLSFGVRALLRRPAFTGVAVATLALGIGADTAIFSVVNGVLLRPLPYPTAADLVTVDVVWASSGGIGPMSYPDLADVEAGTPDLQTLVGYSVGRGTLTGLGEPRVVTRTALTEGLLATFGLAPALGRDVRRDEFGRDAPRVVLVSHDFWLGSLGGAPDVLGRTLELDGVAFEVVGVAPVGFDFPEGTELWIPRRMDLEACGRGCHGWDTVGRLRPGAPLAPIQARLDGIGAELVRAYPETNTNTTFAVTRLRQHMVGDVGRGLWLLLGAVGLVLLIACANVANLLLVRASSRVGEVAVRSALGASPGRLRLQVLVESALLAGAGGGAGVALAYGAVGLLRRVSPGTIPRIDQVGVDGTVLLFAGGLVVGVTLLFGLVPALRASDAPLRGGLSRARHGGGDRSRGALVTTEVALCLVLLVGAGLLMRTLGKLYAVDLGFETRQVVRFTLDLPEARYPTLPGIRTFYRSLEERIAALPGVEGVGSIYGAPLSRVGSTGDVLVEDRPEPPPGEAPGAAIRPVGPGYLGAVRIPLLRGRLLAPSDDAGPERVAVVNERFAARVFPGEDPIGRSVRVTVDMGFGSPYWRIVGVVGDVRSSSLERSPYAEIYVPQGQYGPGYMTVTVRAAEGSGPLLPALREEVRAADRDLPLIAPEIMSEVVGRQVAPTRFYLLLIALFAGVAVALAGVGLYGVVSYLVSRRTREIGLRVALGADRGAIVRMVVREGLRPAVLGVVIGLALALSGAHVLDSLLYGVAPRDPWIFAAVTAFLAGLVLLASWLPARRVARIDPTEAMRVE